MKECKQTETQSVYEHGVSVCRHLTELLHYLDNPCHQLPNWKIPEWLPLYREKLQSSILPQHVLKTYALYHDCGKPFCLTVDENGNRHFPNHAIVSYQTWLEFGGDQQIANLILRDMEIHTIKAVDLESFCLEQQTAISLLLVGLCEVHANAELFGGVDSVSFKIKWSQLNKRGKAICKLLYGEIK